MLVLWHVGPLLGNYREAKTIKNGRYCETTHKHQQIPEPSMTRCNEQDSIDS